MVESGRHQRTFCHVSGAGNSKRLGTSVCRRHRKWRREAVDDEARHEAAGAHANEARHTAEDDTDSQERARRALHAWHPRRLQWRSEHHRTVPLELAQGRQGNGPEGAGRRGVLWVLRMS